MSTVRDNGLALRKVHSFGCPENAVRDAIGHIHHAIAVELHHVCFGNIKIGVMSGHQRVMTQSIAQFSCALDAAGNHRVRKQRALGY